MSGAKKFTRYSETLNTEVVHTPYSFVQEQTIQFLLELATEMFIPSLKKKAIVLILEPVLPSQPPCTLTKDCFRIIATFAKKRKCQHVIFVLDMRIVNKTLINGMRTKLEGLSYQLIDKYKLLVDATKHVYHLEHTILSEPEKKTQLTHFFGTNYTKLKTKKERDNFAIKKMKWIYSTDQSLNNRPCKRGDLIRIETSTPHGLEYEYRIVVSRKG